MERMGIGLDEEIIKKKYFSNPVIGAKRYE